MIVDDVTSDSTTVTTDETGDGSSVLVVLDENNLKYPTTEMVSSDLSWIDSYSPMGKEHKWTFEESHKSGTIPNSCMLWLKTLHSRSRNSKSPTKTTITISEPLCPVPNVLDPLCSDEEEENKSYKNPSISIGRPVSIEYILLPNVGPTSPQVSYFNIPNASSKTRKHDNIAGVISKIDSSERKINIASESEESPLEDTDSHIMTEDSVKSLVRIQVRVKH